MVGGENLGTAATALALVDGLRLTTYNKVMSTIVLTWELGGGLGHILKMRPVAQALVQRGHRVVAILKDVVRGHYFFDPLGIPCLPAPIQQRPPANQFGAAHTFGHVLHDSGFSNAKSLQARASSWRQLYELIQPDLVLCDHSPTALLAARAFPCRRVVMGTGFACPSHCAEFLDWRPSLGADRDKLNQDDAAVVACVNQVLSNWNCPPLSHLTDLYSDADEVLLFTFEELDPFAPRSDQRYWGIWPEPGGATPQWPVGNGPKVLAYLKPFPSQRALLEELSGRNIPTILFAPQVPVEMRKRFDNSSLQFVDEPMDLTVAAKQCDFAILNGTNATTAAILLAGKPILQIPLMLEQRLTTERNIQHGMAIGGSDQKGEQLVSALKDMLARCDALTAGAQRFASKYAAIDPAVQIQEAADRLEELAAAIR